MQSLDPEERSQIIMTIADNLIKRKPEILIANEADLREARACGISGSLYARLAITGAKLAALANGLRQIAESSYDNVGKVVRKTKVGFLTITV